MSVFDFTDPIEFLTDHFNQRKSSDQKFGYGAWARELEIRLQNLKDLLQEKKKIKVRHSEVFASNIGLNANESRYLKLLIKRKNSQSNDDREFYSELIAEMGEKPSQQVWVDDGEILGDWIALTLIDLANVEGFQFTLENVKKCLVKDVELGEIRRSLEKLIKAGLLKETGSGQYRGLKKEVVSRENIRPEAVHHWYREVADLSKETLKGDFSKRYFQCFTVPVSRSRLESLKKMMLALRREMISACEFHGDDVYQVNLQMFPLTQVSEEQRVFENRGALSLQE